MKKYATTNDLGERRHMQNTATADIVIFGGGIAGLWLLHRLRQSGFSAILFESHTLGGGQTHKAQGIIHGGMKYALQGKFTNEVTTMSDMPSVWRACLQGKGEIDLSAVPILSSEQYLWSPSKFASKLTGFLASAALTSKVTSMPKAKYPIVFQHAKFKGEVFSLDELVIDVPAVVRELARANNDGVFKIESLHENDLELDEQGRLQSVTVSHAGHRVVIHAQRFIFTAGAGNDVIIKKLNLPEIAMQLRPLHMVMVKTPFRYPLYAHCLGLGPRPRITITTHYMQDDSVIWYLGGLIAEEGVNRDSETQIKATRNELHALFPWLDFSSAEFSTFMIDRAEPLQKSGLKPDSSFSKVIQNVTIAWPTKLALAPKLAAEIIANIRCTPKGMDSRALRAWPMPTLAQPVWEEAFAKRRVGKTDIAVSIIGLGTVKFGRNEGVKYPVAFQLPSDQEIINLLHVARELGINLLDTAPAYGTSEERLGNALRGQRHEWIISTKVGEEFIEGESHFDFSPHAVTQSIERSLNRLQTDYLDIVLVHSDGNDVRIIEEDYVFSQLAALKKAGKIRAFGMSTKTVAGGRLAVELSDAVMVAMNPSYTGEQEVISYAYQQHKGIFVKKALESGYLKIPINEAMRFIFAEPGVTSVVVGTLNPCTMEMLSHTGRCLIQC